MAQQQENRSISVQPITQGDLPFLYRVYASTREDELAQTGWDTAQKESFLRMQFEAQHQYYQEMFADADYQIILLDGEPAGRLYLDHRQNEIRIIDIALLPEHRGQGTGTRIMEAILADGTEKGLPVRIHVEQNNPAMQLYLRLGFTKIGESGIYYLMEWHPHAE